jgi:hypothetical protein
MTSSMPGPGGGAATATATGPQRTSCRGNGGGEQQYEEAGGPHTRRWAPFERTLRPD